ncbi:MAG TPA: hypothetical protein VLD57_02240, partial [Blastocatellia bacterium]|nr:hypothetical protein [Blastocatellia bacterium]
MLLGLALLIPVARFCYSRIESQNRFIKTAITFNRTMATAALLLLTLDATITRSQTAGSRLYIISTDSKSNDALKTVSRNASLNEQFSIELENPESDQPEKRMEQSPLIHENYAGVVVGTRSASQALQIAELVKRRIRAPLFVVIDSSSASAPDIGISSIDSDGRAILGVPTVIQATVHARGMAARPTKVILSDEVRTVGSATIDWKSEEESVILRIPFIPAVEGVNRYTLRADPYELEKDNENNERSFSLDVRRAGRRILFIENQPTWDGKFIRRAFESGGLLKVDYFAQISRDARLAQISPDGERDLRKTLHNFKLLAQYDAIIAGPVDAAALSGSQARNINDFIERRGGGLILLGGNDYVGSIISPSSPLLHLSPARVAVGKRAGDEQLVEPANSAVPEAGEPEKLPEPATYLVPTRQGISAGLFRLKGEETEIERLGPISNTYLRVSELKPGATAFATDSSAVGAHENILVAGQSYGLGHTLLVSPSDLWRGQLGEAKGGESAFDSFWKNLAFWATAGVEPPSYIRLASGSIQTGRPVTAYLTTRDKTFNLPERLSVEAEA